MFKAAFPLLFFMKRPAGMSYARLLKNILLPNAFNVFRTASDYNSLIRLRAIHDYKDRGILLGENISCLRPL